MDSDRCPSSDPLSIFFEGSAYAYPPGAIYCRTEHLGVSRSQLCANHWRQPSQHLTPIHSPQPAPQPATIAPDTALQTEKQLNARQLQLSTLITPQRIDISGVNAIAFAEVAVLFQPLAGKPVSIAHLALAAQAATQLYQKAGYPCPLSICPRRLLKTASCA